MINSQEILKQTDIKSAKTLTRWHQRGLIPPPNIGTHPCGRGKIAFWPDWVLDRIREIKRLLAEGMGLDEIKQQLGTDWQQIEKRKIRKHRDFARALEIDRRQKAADAFSEIMFNAIYSFLIDMGVQRPGNLTSLDDQIDSLPVINAVLELVQQGFNPVIVIIGEEINVTTDFMLAHLAGRSDLQSQPMLVMPIREEICKAYKEAVENLPERATYFPCKCLVDKSDTKPKQRKYKIRSKWKHAFVTKK